MNQDAILLSMFASYFLPIVFVYYKYSNTAVECGGHSTRSISSIITSKEPLFQWNDAGSSTTPNVFQTRHFIATSMLIMAGFTVVYEYQRCVTSITRIWWSLASISVLLVGIFGVIFIPEQNPTHYIFGGAAFFAIVGFMVGHTAVACNSTGTCVSDNLRILLYAQCLFMVVTIIGVLQVARIFAIEALFLLNFAVFYLYIHFNNNK